MSLIAISAMISSAALHSLILSVTAAGGMAAITNVLCGQIEEHGLNSLLKDNLLAEISLDEKLADNIEDVALRGTLRSELEKLKGAIGERVKRQEGLMQSFEELNSIRKRLRAAKIDSDQCIARQTSARNMLESLRNSGDGVYARECGRLEGELEKISALPLEERMQELQGLLDELTEMEGLQNLASGIDLSAVTENRYVFESAPKTPDAKDAREQARIAREIRDFAGRIALIDEAEGEKLRPILEGLKADTQFPDRLAILKKQMKADWAAIRERLAMTEFLRGSLSGIADEIKGSPEFMGHGASELLQRYDALCAQKFMDREEAMRLYEDLASYVFKRAGEIADSMLVKKLQTTMEEMGYELIADENRDAGLFEKDKVHYLESPYEDYRVMLKVSDGGEISTRLVRAARAGEDKNAPSAAQAQKDLETGKKWCGDLDAFLQRMKESGFPLDIRLRKEPEEAAVLVVDDKNPRGAKRGKKRKEREAGRYMEMDRDKGEA